MMRTPDGHGRLKMRIGSATSAGPEGLLIGLAHELS
jgi:hypothetical protein